MKKKHKYDRKKPHSSELIEDSLPLDLKTLSWKLQGLGRLLANTDTDAPMSKQELYGVGEQFRELGLWLEIEAEALERYWFSDPKGVKAFDSTKARS